TSAPTASTTPMNSWPIRWPVSLSSIWLYGQRSLPQMQARVTRRRASVGSMMRASGTSSIRTSPAPYMTVALMHGTQAGDDSPCPTLSIQVVAGPQDDVRLPARGRWYDALGHPGSSDQRRRDARCAMEPVHGARALR